MKKILVVLFMVLLYGFFVGSVSAQEEEYTMPAWGKYVASGFYMRDYVMEFDPNVGHSFLIQEGLFVADFDGDGAIMFSTVGEDDWATYNDHGIDMVWGEFMGFISQRGGLTTFGLRYPDESMVLFVLTHIKK